MPKGTPVASVRWSATSTLGIGLGSAALVALLALGAAGATETDVKLVLQITVDQLRGDTLTRFGDRFGDGGFRYFLDHGTHFTDAHYRYANTETAPGHATLVTGADPARHGIVANDWIDRQTGAFVYNTEDDRHHIIGAEPRPHQGVSPRNLLASTIGDELVVDGAWPLAGVQRLDQGPGCHPARRPCRQGVLVLAQRWRVRHQHLLLR